MRTIKSFLPVFTGFYNTIFEFDREVDEIDNYNMENDTDLSYDDFNWDYEDYEQRVSEACVDAIEHELTYLGIKAKFEKLVSPRFYNYTNDSVNVVYELEDDSMQKLIDFIREHEMDFIQWIADRYTSRSGFSSFYSNDSEVWLTEYINDEDKLEHCFGALLEFYFEMQEYGQDSLWDAISHEIWINYTTIEDTPTEEDLREYKDISLTEQ
ncbi:MAG: hypothetical protein PQJ49_06245 [Sphaerochaetaceae bacterium]|nr:hypothetical protein [Sphaerochaetaceae bacterium]